MTPEEKAQFEKTLNDLKLPEADQLPSETSLPDQAEQIDAVNVELPALATDPPPATGAIGDVQRAFQDGAGETVKPHLSDFWGSRQKANEEQERVLPLERKPAEENPGEFDVQLPKQPKFEKLEGPEGADVAPDLPNFFREMEAAGKLDADGAIDWNKVGAQPQAGDAPPNVEAQVNEAAKGAAREVGGAIHEIVDVLREFAVEIGQLRNEIQQIRRGMQRRRA
jgi:hypothetical protein